MAVIRLIILVTVVVGLILLVTQNFSPSLPLVFLGMRTQTLPLALWILLSIAAGVATFLIITSLFRFAIYLSLQAQQPIPKSIPNSPRVKKDTPRPSSPPPPVTPTDDEFDDWDTNGDADNWDFGENSQPLPKTSESQQSSPKNSRSNSVYSYSSQEPKNTAVGKTESIYDADYRVIIPPYQESSQNQATDDDDWDFFEDDEFEDDDENQPQKR
ncbi:LapA family protein [Anabaena sp. UHCC 0253]|uniref:LapA family protein n=1 Tax=Anabaena sp. UHCC 0253 TaxID=2590019 RepID=UPI00144600BB|nr:LapA family protein [Anabaena sp. UHCC 0253]MTJ52415.1 LapA family protein [Anabaena sp. UHCC 0253]